MSKSETVELWAERLRRFELAGTTVAALCAAQGVSQPTNNNRRRKQRGPANKTEPKAASPPPAFLPVALASQAEQPDNPPRALTTIELPGGIRIRVEVQTEPRSDKQLEDRS
jgi:hypothetical protein